MAVDELVRFLPFLLDWRDGERESVFTFSVYTLNICQAVTCQPLRGRVSNARSAASCGAVGGLRMWTGMSVCLYISEFLTRCGLKYIAWARGNVFVYAAVLVSGFGLLFPHQKMAVVLTSRRN